MQRKFWFYNMANNQLHTIFSVIRNTLLLKESIGRIGYIAVYLIFHAAIFLIVKFLFLINFKYIFYSFFVLSAISIVFTCFLSYKRLLDIDPKYSVIALIPLLGFATDPKWLILFGLNGSTFYNFSVAPYLAILGMFFIIVLAVIPGSKKSNVLNPPQFQ